jgi:hypothetical protein
MGILRRGNSAQVPICPQDGLQAENEIVIKLKALFYSMHVS